MTPDELRERILSAPPPDPDAPCSHDPHPCWAVNCLRHRAETTAKDEARARVQSFLDTYEGTAFPDTIQTMSDGYSFRDLLASDLRLIVGREGS